MERNNILYKITDMKKDIRNYNKAGEFHGYQELYDTNSVLSYRGSANNGYGIGYSETHFLTRLTYYVIR
jgi:hypothetical protein